MSAYICSMVATIFVVLVVDVEVSICSMYLILFLRFSSLKLKAWNMSRISTGFDDTFGSSLCGAVPFYFRIVDMCGSFLALAADPMTKTNFASSSFAISWRACSLA